MFNLFSGWPHAGLLFCSLGCVLAWGQTAPSLLWKEGTGGVIFSSPAIDGNGDVYVGSNDNSVHAFDSNGTLKWTYQTGNWVDSTPAIGTDGTLYVGSWDNQLHAVNSTNGEGLWTFNTNNYITASPVIGSNGLICFGSKDSVFYALEANGSLAWEYFAGDPIFASAAVGEDGSIYFGDEGGVFHALNPDGTLKWTYETDVTTDTNNSILSSPAIDSLGNLYFGCGNGYCYSLADNGESASLNWKYLTGDRVDASPVLGLNDDVIFAGRDGYIRSLPTFSSNEDNVAAWEELVGDVFYSSPVVDANGWVYVIAYAGGGENHLFCFDALGNKQWDSSGDGFSFTIDGVVDSSPALTAGGKLYFGCYDSFLYCMDLSEGPASSDWPMFQRSALRMGSWPSYTLFVSVSSEGTGTVSGGGTFAQGTLVTLTATPSANFQFTQWSNGSTANPYNFTPTTNTELSAEFVELFTLGLSSGQGGSVSPSGTESHPAGSSVSITATPDTGYSFTGWTGDGVASPGSATSSVSMTQGRSVAATFSINSYDLSVSAGQGGSTSGGGSFNYASDATITATPDTGYSFAGWTGDGVASTGSATSSVSMTQDRSVAATFSINSYDLSISAGEGGSVTGGGSYTYDSDADINATPNTGYSFAGWDGDGVASPGSSSTTVSMTQSRSVAATFTINSYDLTLSAGDGGSVTGGGSYTYGSDATITATPDTGYSFAGWTGDGIANSASASTTVSMAQDRSATATFTINSYDLTLSAGDGGSVSGGGSFTYGSTADINATPDTGYSFAGWNGDGVANPDSSSTIVSMTQDRSVAATFSINSYDLSLSAGEGGSVTGGGSYTYDSDADINATPNTGYSFAGWDGDGVASPGSSSTTVSMTQSRSVAATFTINSYDLTLSAGDGGSVSGGGSFTYGSAADINATPNTGYSFAGWNGDGVNDSTTANTFVSITQNQSVSASFSINSYDLTLSAGDGGSVTGGGSYTYGSDATITATPDTGYSFAGWTGDGIANSASASTTVSMAQDRSATATFTINSYDLTLSAGDGGSVSGGGSFTYGSTADINATPDTGYSFAGWNGDGVANPDSSSTIVSMTQDRSVAATFSINSYDLSLSAGEGGSVTGGGSYTYDSDADINATPNTGYSFAGWDGDGVASPGSSSTTVSMTQSRSVAATFTINSYDLTLSAGDGGSVSGGGSFTYGSAADINATPNTGYSFAGWNGDGVNDSTTANTFVSITQNQSVSASFSINSYDLTLSAGDGGSVTGGGSYTYGSDATITATPDTGYSFAGWLGEGMEDSNSLSTSVSMTQDRILTASFTPREIDRYLLVISSLPSSAGVTSGAEEYEDESNVSITATAATGYSFTGWTGDGITNPNLASTSVFMDQDRNITANFATNFYDLNLSAGEGGTVSDGGRFPYNSTADISATPDMGYSFAGWNGSGVATPNSSSTTVSMIQDRYISASFSINSYILNLSSGTGGSLSGAGTYTYGSIINISATPKTGYSFTGWTGSGISDFGSASTSVSITQDRNISATFSINSYLLSLSSGDGGSVSGSGSFLYETSADINATPNTGYSFAGWSGNGVATPNSISTTVSMTQNRSISAAFSLNSYTLALSAGTGGTVSNSGSYSYGASVTITATPSTGYSFAGWSGDGVASPSSATSSVSITQDRNLTAHFTKNLHALSISTPEGGTVNDSGTHEFGSTVGLVAEAATGYVFSHWEGSLVATPNSASTSILLTKNSSVEAIFERLPGFWNQSWMGWVLQNDKNWLYHYPLGWMYSSSAKTSNDYWLWHPELQWIWLEREAFSKSQAWMNTKQGWIFIDTETANDFRYYDYIEKIWISF